MVENFPLLLDTGEYTDVSIQNPLAMLSAVARESDYFTNLLATTYARQPCTREKPWTIVLYS